MIWRLWTWTILFQDQSFRWWERWRKRKSCALIKLGDLVLLIKLRLVSLVLPLSPSFLCSLKMSLGNTPSFSKYRQQIKIDKEEMLTVECERCTWRPNSLLSCSPSFHLDLGEFARVLKEKGLQFSILDWCTADRLTRHRRTCLSSANRGASVKRTSLAADTSATSSLLLCPFRFVVSVSPFSSNSNFIHSLFYPNASLSPRASRLKFVKQQPLLLRNFSR